MTRPSNRLFLAPEIIVADLADAALNALEHALRREHPRLDAPLFAEQPPVRRQARAILIHTEHLRAALRAYRRIVRKQCRRVEDSDALF
jgi:hypothetical protein